MAALKMIITWKSEKRSIDQAHVKPSVPKLHLKVTNILMITQNCGKNLFKVFYTATFQIILWIMLAIIAFYITAEIKNV